MDPKPSKKHKYKKGDAKVFTNKSKSENSITDNGWNVEDIFSQQLLLDCWLFSVAHSS